MTRPIKLRDKRRTRDRAIPSFLDGGPGSGPRPGKEAREFGKEAIHEQNKKMPFNKMSKSERRSWRAKAAAATDATPIVVVLGDVVPPTPIPLTQSDAATHFMLFDNLTIDEAAKVRITPDGYLTAMPRVAKVGVQIYHGDECGKPEMESVRVYRPPDTVFNKDSMHGFAHKPVTLNHPNVRVTSDNWKAVSVGHIGDEVLRDGDSIRVPMVLMDAKAIKAYEDGHRQLSMGYTCDIRWESGVTPDGETYDAIQVPGSLVPNHLAVVPAARGGPTLCIGDNVSQVKQEDQMNAVLPNFKNVMVDGIQVEMTDTAASVVNRLIDGYRQQLDAWKKKKDDDDDEDEKEAEEQDKKDAAVAELIKTKDTKIGELETAMKAKDAEIVTVKQQLKDAVLRPEQIDALVKDRQATFDKCRRLLGDRFVADGKTVEDMQKMVVQAKVGDACKGWDDNQIRASFDTIVDFLGANPGAGSFNDGRGGAVNDAVRVFAGQPGHGYQHFDDGQAVKAAAYNEMVADMQDAWKTPEVRDAEKALRDAQRRSGH